MNAAYYFEHLDKFREETRFWHTASCFFTLTPGIHTAAAIQAKLEDLHWSALDHPAIVLIYRHVIFIC